MTLYLASFLAGVITIAAPCVLPVLPVVLGGSLAGKSAKRPLIITLSLAVSIVTFTLLLRASTVLIAVPLSVWSTISGVIVLAFGIILLFPNTWERASAALGFNAKSQTLLGKAGKKEGVTGMIMIGAALGPVFASCSPTYALILAIVLPANYLAGVVHISLYALGLSIVMFAVAFFGQKAVKKLRFAADPHGKFRKGLGIVFVIVGIAIIMGMDKRIEAAIIESGYFGIMAWEEMLAEQFRNAGASQ